HCRPLDTTGPRRVHPGQPAFCDFGHPPRPARSAVQSRLRGERTNAMTRAVIAGSGSEIPPTRVTNAMLARIMDTSDEWIRERSGVETRHYVERGVGTSDLGVAAARRALDRAGVRREAVEMVVFATMTPDHYFPGSGALLQAKLGLRDVPCFDIRQQCVGFLYGLQLADAQVRAGLARTVLLVGAEIHTGFMPWTAANW